MGNSSTSSYVYSPETVVSPYDSHFFWGGGRGVYRRGQHGTRSLNMNKCPISPQSPAGASKNMYVYVLYSWVYGVSKVVKKMWGVRG